jgi:hypothetical protein
VTCILVLSKTFIKACTSGCLQKMNNIKIYIKTAPTCFTAVTPSSGSSLSLLLKLHFVTITNYGKSVCDYISGDVGAYIGRSVMNYSLNFNLVFNKITCSFVGEQTTLIVNFTFKVCNSVHHRKIQIHHQPDATIFQFIILTFIYNSTCFGSFPAHHLELND